MEGDLQNRLNDFWHRYVQNKYTITLVAFVVWICFLDGNNLVRSEGIRRENAKLREEIEYYNRSIEQNIRDLDELRTNTEALEKYAREHYFMKNDNEDIFIIVEEQ